MLLVIAANALCQHSAFKVIPLGVKGGGDESNLSAYMIAATGSDTYVCLDAGTLHAGIEKAISNKIFPYASDKILRQNIKGYLISHGHLDHLSGLILNSPDDTSKNIYAMNCNLSSPNLDIILRLKTSSSRGGIIQNVFAKDIKVGTYKNAAVSINMFYEVPGNFMPTIRNIWVENMNIEKGGEFGIYVKAYKESPVENFRMINSTILGVKTPVQIDHIKNSELINVKINDKTVSLPQ